MLRLPFLRQSLGVMANITTILMFVVFTAVSWGALQPILSSGLQWLGSVVDSPFVLVALSRMLQIGVAGFAGWHLTQLIDKRFHAIGLAMDQQWLENLETHTQTQQWVDEITRTLHEGIRDRGLDVQRLYMENRVQQMILMGLVLHATKSDVLSAIVSRRKLVQAAMTDGDSKNAVLQVIKEYEDLVKGVYVDS